MPVIFAQNREEKPAFIDRRSEPDSPGQVREREQEESEECQAQAQQTCLPAAQQARPRASEPGKALTYLHLQQAQVQVRASASLQARRERHPEERPEAEAWELCRPQQAREWLEPVGFPWASRLQWLPVREMG